MQMKPDCNDWFYYGGLAMLFAGLSVGVSIAVALIVVGALLAAVAVSNSYVALWHSSRKAE
jgi:hypothetical protein